MSGFKFYKYNAGTAVFDLIYTTTNGSIGGSKDSGISPFPLPMVNTTENTTNRMVQEKSDLVSLGGVTASLRLSFRFNIADLKTLMDLVSNKAGIQHKVVIDDWTGTQSNNIFVGVLAHFDFDQKEQETTMTGTFTFYEGDNVFNTLSI